MGDCCGSCNKQDGVRVSHRGLKDCLVFGGDAVARFES